MPAWLQDEDEGIAVEACEFWTAFCESEMDKDVLRPFLPRVLPVLLKNMVRAGCLAARRCSAWGCAIFCRCGWQGTAARAGSLHTPPRHRQSPAWLCMPLIAPLLLPAPWHLACCLGAIAL